MRKSLKKYWLLGSLLILAVSNNLHAVMYGAPRKIYYGEFGIAFDAPQAGSYSDQKVVEIGLQKHYALLEAKYGVGGWADGSTYPGVKSSVYVQTLWGVEPRSQHVYIHYLFGPAFVFKTDSILGSNFQFAHELGVGMRDIRDVRVGVAIKHFSNAGLVKPNYGRNFMVFEAAF